MKLFVWNDVLSNFGQGKAFAMAENKERAIELLRNKFIEDDCDHDLEIAELMVNQLEDKKLIVYENEGCDYLRGSE